MKEITRQKIKWIIGIITIWGSGWALLGIRTLASVSQQPHPFIKSMKLTGIMLSAVTTWALTSLLAYLSIGLISGFITLIGIGTRAPTRLSFKNGCLVGGATFFWIHAVLYTQVPAAMGFLPWINKLPMALCLLALLGTGAGLMARAIWTARGNLPWLRWSGGLLALTLLLLLPHDLFRRLMAGPSKLPDSQRRLLIVSIDGLRRDTFEQAVPGWKAPDGVTPICAFPATRLAWNSLLGASPEKMRYGRVMPYESELRQPEELTLLRTAEIHGVRTAFVIDDSLTPSYSLMPSLFTTVLEPDGGWKYWFTLGFGTSWPVHSWLQNYLSPVETSNPWCDPNAYFRDIGRQLENHGWVSSHNCELHSPIVLRFGELRILSGWKWLGRSAYSYQPYNRVDEIQQDKGIRVGPRASAQRHYTVRAGLLLLRLKPFLTEWEHRFPQLSGVVTSDHGESFPGIFDENRHMVSTFSGIHGFRLDADTIHVPLLGFGLTKSSLQAGSLYSWLDLRDDISTWLKGDSSLGFNSSQPGRIIQITAIQPAHLDSGSGGIASYPRVARQGGGLQIQELMRDITLRRSGLWYCNDLTNKDLEHSIFSTALAVGTRLVIFNPEKDGTFFREDWDGYQPLGAWRYDPAQMDLDIRSFKITTKLPPAPKD